MKRQGYAKVITLLKLIRNIFVGKQKAKCESGSTVGKTF